MSKDLNKWMGIGRLGRDVEIKYTASGDAIANIAIACGDDYKDKQGQKVEKTEWVQVSAFGRLAEIMGEYLTKGSKVYIEGKYTTRKWQDQQGQDRYTTSIKATEMQMLDSRETGDNVKNYQNAPPKPIPTNQQQQASQPQYNQAPPQPQQPQPQQQQQGNQPPANTGQPNNQNDDSFDDDIPF